MALWLLETWSLTFESPCRWPASCTKIPAELIRSSRAESWGGAKIDVYIEILFSICSLLYHTQISTSQKHESRDYGQSQKTRPIL